MPTFFYDGVEITYGDPYEPNIFPLLAGDKMVVDKGINNLGEMVYPDYDEMIVFAQMFDPDDPQDPFMELEEMLKEGVYEILWGDISDSAQKWYVVERVGFTDPSDSIIGAESEFILVAEAWIHSVMPTTAREEKNLVQMIRCGIPEEDFTLLRMIGAIGDWDKMDGFNPLVELRSNPDRAITEMIIEEFALLVGWKKLNKPKKKYAMPVSIADALKQAAGRYIWFYIE